MHLRQYLNVQQKYKVRLGDFAHFIDRKSIEHYFKLNTFNKSFPIHEHNYQNEIIQFLLFFSNYD